MKIASPLIAALLLILNSTLHLEASEPVQLKLESVQKIWDQDPHNAFTGLTRFKDQWFCVFRTGKAHVSNDGALQVLSSKDGKDWKPVARLTSETADLRDAKIAVTPKGQLMLSGAAALHQPNPIRHESMTWFSDDGTHWSKGNVIGDPNMWLWGMRWHEGNVYSIGYQTGKTAPKFTRLYKSKNGIKYETVVDKLIDKGYSNESSLIFTKDKTCYCLLRRDGSGKGANGLLGVAKPPYTDWTWKDLGVKIGGPELFQLPDGRFLATVRLYSPKAHTSICQIDVEKGTLTELIKLPSGGDTSYANMVLHDGVLNVSYYSSHEGKTSIYFAKVSYK
ncbi:MAG: exo-alpha-sialidase [Gimesia sp.]|nr:exo-alpha-sialidase [Gimesia sp.]